VYALRSDDEIEGLLAESGFVEIGSAERAIGRSRFAYTHARSPGPARDQG
jgi:hypothetical protein